MTGPEWGWEGKHVDGAVRGFSSREDAIDAARVELYDSCVGKTIARIGTVKDVDISHGVCGRDIDAEYMLDHMMASLTVHKSSWRIHDDDPYLVTKQVAAEALRQMMLTWYYTYLRWHAWRLVDAVEEIMITCSPR